MYAITKFLEISYAQKNLEEFTESWELHVIQKGFNIVYCYGCQDQSNQLTSKLDTALKIIQF